MSDISDQVESDALKPAAARSDAGSVQQRPLGELIDADRYTALETNVASERRGLRISQIVPPGAV